MLEQMMRAVARKIIAQEYPHAKSPAVVYATVSKATQLGETFDLEDLVIHNDETGSSFKGHITAHWNEYTLTVVDRWGTRTRASLLSLASDPKDNIRPGPSWPLRWHTGTARRSLGRCSYDRVTRHRHPTQ